jgi:hypothetical protein
MNGMSLSITKNKNNSSIVISYKKILSHIKTNNNFKFILTYPSDTNYH